MVQEAKVIQEWGAFYLTRKAFDIQTKSQYWLAEAGKIIIKITTVLVAFVFDLLTGVLYILFIVIKSTIVVLANLLGKFATMLVEKLISLLAYLLALVLTIAILYLIITHWDLFTSFIEKIFSYGY